MRYFDRSCSSIYVREARVNRMYSGLQNTTTFVLSEFAMYMVSPGLYNLYVASTCGGYFRYTMATRRTLMEAHAAAARCRVAHDLPTLVAVLQDYATWLRGAGRSIEGAS